MSSTTGCKMTLTLKRPINIFLLTITGIAGRCLFNAFAGRHIIGRLRCRDERVESETRNPLSSVSEACEPLGGSKSRSVSFQVELHPSKNTPTAHLRCTQTGLLTRNINSLVSRPYVQYADGWGPINICPVASRLAFSASFHGCICSKSAAT